jgi:hypothetical protein
VGIVVNVEYGVWAVEWLLKYVVLTRIPNGVQPNGWSYRCIWPQIGWWRIR